MFSVIRSLRKSALGLRRRWLGDRAIVRVRGRRFAVNLADERFTARLYYGRAHEPEEADLLGRLFAPGMTVLDVGANIGLHTVEAAVRVHPGGRVVAFEPDPVNRALLEENCARNGCDNVTVVASAVGDAVGQLTLYRSAVNYGDHRIYNGADDDRYNADRPRTTLTVPVTTVDAYVRAHGLRVDFVKSDIQGAEARLWRGMRQTVAGRPDLRVLMEFWPYGIRGCGDDPVALLDEIAGAGFGLYVLDGGSLRRRAPGALLASLPGEHFTNVLCSRSVPPGTSA